MAPLKSIVLTCFALCMMFFASVHGHGSPATMPPDLTNWLTSPNGNEVFTVGQTISVTINTGVYRPPVITVALYKGTTLITQSASTMVTGRTISTTGLAIGSDYRVRIYNTNAPAEEDYSNATFTIGPIPNLGSWLTTPNGGQTFNIGTVINVGINASLYTPYTTAVELYDGSAKVLGPFYGGTSGRTLSTETLSPGTAYKVRIFNPSKPAEEDWSDAPFTLQHPVLDSWLSAPNGTEYYKAGASIPVSINAAVYAPASVSVELYKGSTLVYGPVTGGTSGRTIPTAGLTPGSDYKVRIYNTSVPAQEDRSWQPFVIGASTPPADLSNWLRTPNGGEEVPIGASIDVVIDAVMYLPDAVGIELYKGAQLIQSSGFSGTARTQLSTAGLSSGTDYRIKVIDLSNTARYDWSNSTFTIGLSRWLQSPNGGESYTSGAAIPVSIKTATYNPSSVSLELYKGQTKVYGPVSGGASGRTIPTTGMSSGSDYKVRIFDTGIPANEDWSDNTFSLQAPNLGNWLTSPNGNEVYNVGQTVPVAIDGAIYSPFLVTVSLYKGNTHITSNTSPGITGRTISTTGLQIGSDYKVKIVNANTPAEEDWSNNSFTIGPIPDLSNWLISPNGGQTFNVGKIINVDINSALYAPYTVALEVYSGSTRVAGPFYGGAANRTIPTSDFSPGTDYKIRIFNPDRPTEEDWSAAPFAIQIPSLASWLLSPNGTEIYAKGTPVPVTINGDLYAPTSVSVELYKGTTLVYGPVTGSVTGRTIPTATLTPGNDYKVRIYNTNNPSLEDTSTQPFIIGAATAPSDLSAWLVTPNGSERFSAGETITVRIDAVKYYPGITAVEVFRGAELVYSTAFPAGANRVSIATASFPADDNYRIHVFDLNDRTKEDWSDQPFIIFPAGLESWVNPLGESSFPRNRIVSVTINRSIYDPASLSIELYKDGQLVLGPFAGPPRDRTIKLSNVLIGSGYQIKVYDTSKPAFLDWTDETFSITAERITYIRSTEIFTGNITGEAQIGPLEDDEKKVNLGFMDGMGRPIQDVTINGSPTFQDVVQPIVYDELGRQTRQYLPFTTDAADWFIQPGQLFDANGNYVNAPAQFYNGQVDNVATTTQPYAQTVFEASPLNRVLKQGSPGEAWQPSTSGNFYADKTVKTAYLLNGSDEVALFRYNSTSGTITLSPTGGERFYQPNTLYVQKKFDEHNNEAIEFTDKLGRVICKKVQYAIENSVKKYASTYYVYDDLGHLVVVLPPEAVKQLLGE